MKKNKKRYTIEEINKFVEKNNLGINICNNMKGDKIKVGYKTIYFADEVKVRGKFVGRNFANSYKLKKA